MAFPTDWKYKVAITIDADGIDADLTDWTMVFDQSFDDVLTQADGPLDADGTRPSINGGGDVRFSSDSAGSSRLACDIREWTTNDNPSLATEEVAVKVASVSSSVDVTIYMWWGKDGETQPSVSDTYGQYKAYDSDYVLILPLHEDVADNSWKDRTSGQHHASKTSSPTITRVSGKVGDCIHAADDANDGYLEVASFSDVENMTALSIECNARRTGAGDLYNEIVRKTTVNAWFLLVNDTNYFRMSKMGNSSEYQGSGQFATFDTWYHICGTGTYSTTKLYANGLDKQTTSINGIVSNTDSIHITNYSGGIQQYVGDVDELRISKVARSQAWAKANYNNQFDASGFLTWGGILDTAAKPRSFGYIIG